MDFIQCFQEELRIKGYQVYKEQRVKYFAYRKSTFESIVRGYYNYDVNIDMVNQKIIEMSCTCEASQKGASCKHMIATLYKIKEYYDYKLVLEDDLKEKTRDELIEYIIDQSWK